jgi:hypothetical protein
VWERERETFVYVWQVCVCVHPTEVVCGIKVLQQSLASLSPSAPSKSLYLSLFLSLFPSLHLAPFLLLFVFLMVCAHTARHTNAETEADTYGTTRKRNKQIKASFVLGGERLKHIISQVQDF